MNTGFTQSQRSTADVDAKIHTYLAKVKEWKCSLVPLPQLHNAQITHNTIIMPTIVPKNTFTRFLHKLCHASLLRQGLLGLLIRKLTKF